MIAIPEEIKALLMQDGTRKNFRVHFPNGEHTDITNENIISESVSFTESICSQQELKFGLCESPVIEFETFGIGKIKGAEIECSIEVDYIGEYTNEYTVPAPSSGTKTEEVIFTPDIDVKGQIVINAKSYFIGAGPRGMRYSYSVDGITETITTTNVKVKSLGSNINEYSYEEIIDADGHLDNIHLFDITSINYQNIVLKAKASIKADEKKVYSMPLGKFVIDSCKKQADMTHRKVIAYGISAVAKESISDKLIASVKVFDNNKYTHDIVKRAMTYLGSQSVKNICEPGTEFRLGTELSRGIDLTLIATDQGMITYRISLMNKCDILPENTTDLYAYESGNLLRPLSQMQNEVYDIVKADIEQRIGHMGSAVEKDIINGINKMCNSFAEVKCQKGTNQLITEFDDIDRSDFVLYPFLNPTTNEKINTSVYIPYKYVVRCITEEEDIHLTDEVVFRDKNQITSCIVNFDLFGKYTETADRVKNTDNNVTGYVINSSWENEEAKKIIESVLELKGKFGKTGRDGSIEPIALTDKFTALYPDETLFPYDNLFPGGVVGADLTRSNYINLWYDDDYTIPINIVKCVFNNGTEERQVNYSNGRSRGPSKIYDLSNNELIKSAPIDELTLYPMLNTFLDNTSGISYMPAEVEMKGRPDLEAGDVLEITTTDETITTIILQRTISGIQNLIDDIRSI